MPGFTLTERGGHELILLSPHAVLFIDVGCRMNDGLRRSSRPSNANRHCGRVRWLSRCSSQHIPHIQA